MQRVAGSAINLVVRFGALSLLSAISTIALTRVLGPGGYGPFASAVATWVVLGAAADFGFNLMLSRDGGRDGRLSSNMFRSAYEVAIAWCLLLTAVQVGLAFSAGPGTIRGEALLVLAPSMIFNGLNPARAAFLISYQTRRLLLIDTATAGLQVVAIIGLLAMSLGPVSIAATLSVVSVLNGVAVLTSARRLMDPVQKPDFTRRELIRRSAPLGLMALMTQVFFTIDLVILGWLVSGPRLGDYAAASKMLTILTGIAGMVMAGALPALSAEAKAGRALEQLVARIWTWLVVGAVPVFVVVAAAAPLVVLVTVGSRYAGAAVLLRILCVAGVVSILNNVLGNLMIALHKMRALFIQNSAAIALNVAGNLVLVPRIGVAAAAWMTLATELLVCLGALMALRSELSFREALAVNVRLRPLVARQ